MKETLSEMLNKFFCKYRKPATYERPQWLKTLKIISKIIEIILLIFFLGFSLVLITGLHSGIFLIDLFMILAFPLGVIYALGTFPVSLVDIVISAAIEITDIVYSIKHSYQ